jgi:hypothetical protein
MMFMLGIFIMLVDDGQRIMRIKMCWEKDEKKIFYVEYMRQGLISQALLGILLLLRKLCVCSNKLVLWLNVIQVSTHIASLLLHQRRVWKDSKWAQLEKIAMILTVVMKLQQQFIIVTLIEGGGLTQQLPVKRRISVAILMHMVIGATPLLRGAEKVHAKISSTGKMDRDSPTRTRSGILMPPLLILKARAPIFPVLTSN